MDERTPKPARVLLGVAGVLLAPVLLDQALGLIDLTHDAQSALLDTSMLASALATLICAAYRTDRFRLIWGALGIAQLLYAAGDWNLDFVQHDLMTFPTVSDVLWLAYYPLVMLGVAVYLRGRHNLRPLVWLDGAIIVLVLIAGAFALSLGGIIDSATGSDAFVAGQLSYPILDLGFVAFVLILGYAGSLRLGPAYFTASAAALLLFAIDLVYLRQLASQTYVAGTLLDSGWAVTMLLMSITAQLPLRMPSFRVTSAHTVNALTAAVTIPALFLLARGTDHPGGPETVACAALAILLLAVRQLVTVVENQRIARDNRLIVATAGEGIMRADADGRIIYVNPAACEMLGYSEHELVGQVGHQLMHHSHPNGTPYPAEDCPIRGVLSGEGPIRISNEVFWRRDGSSFPVDYTAAPLREDGTAVGVVVVFDDVTAQRSIEARLRYQADHDSLSGVFNRRRFVEEVDEGLARARRYGTGGAVLMLDLDSFKFVNDSFGHKVGDELIRKVASILRERLRESDVVGRLGGDEFAILIPDGSSDEALKLASSLQQLIRSRTEPSIEASFGVAAFDGAEELVADDLVVRADIALYEAKQQGRAAVAWHERRGTRLTWVGKIRDAIADDRLTLYSQPILDLHTDTVASEELLVRLLDEDGDVIPPAAFLPTAERFGLMHQIDRLVVRRGLELARSGRRLSINLSARSIDDDEIVRMLQEAVSSGVGEDQITIEVTETAAVGNMDQARRFAERLQRIGISLALDDFGTGLSSLSYLKNIPAQELKIDMEFVHGVAESTMDQYMIRTIVGIAKRLGQQTVAEGVEDGKTLATLRRLGVDRAQGYYLGRPAPVDTRRPRELTSELRRALVAVGTTAVTGGC